ncbi:GAF domain-containing protein [Glaciibacter flavus]|uniref:GAF domain-containing protein n=1 Tax=Orlajensenia flava TaxID=2565934 RepID=A0A4S4G062_9MICO|nr:GAF domain-containing protein [Glaciibacter flavus]THG35456.1 GAF domain-containing protein [Glaciibacter flavus]
MDPQTKRAGRGRTVALTVVPLAAAAAAGPLIGYASRADAWWAAFLFGGILLAVVAIAIQVAVKVRDSRAQLTLAEEMDDLRLTVRDALLPVASLLAEMPGLDLLRRVDHLRTVGQAAVAALHSLVSPHADRARVNVYSLETAPLQMVWLAHIGRGDKPGPFVAGTPRGDAALEFLFEAKSAFYPDLGEARPAGYGGTASGYETFIAVPVFTDKRVWGMVTVDAPTAGSLTPGDLHLSEVVAEMMSVAFASAAAPEPSLHANV